MMQFHVQGITEPDTNSYHLLPVAFAIIHFGHQVQLTHYALSIQVATPLLFCGQQALQAFNFSKDWDITIALIRSNSNFCLLLHKAR